jgi:hypothetical protein
VSYGLHSARRVYLCVPYGPHKNSDCFPKQHVTSRILYRGHNVFAVRYNCPQCICVFRMVLKINTYENGVFWDVTPCGSCKNRRFGGTWRLLHQGNKNRWQFRHHLTADFRPNVGALTSPDSMSPYGPFRWQLFQWAQKQITSPRRSRQKERRRRLQEREWPFKLPFPCHKKWTKFNAISQLRSELNGDPDPDRVNNLLFCAVSWTVLRSIQTLPLWHRGWFPRCVKRPDVNLTAHLHLVSRIYTYTHPYVLIA